MPNAPPRWLLISAAALLIGGIVGPHIPRPDGIPFVEPVKHEGAFVVVVEETSQRTNNIDAAALLNDTTYWQGLKQRKYAGFRFYDVDQEEAKPYAQYTAGHKLPTMIVIAADKSVLWSGEMPTTKDAMDAQLRKVCGL